jgi:hypothetical protein
MHNPIAAQTVIPFLLFQQDPESRFQSLLRSEAIGQGQEESIMGSSPPSADWAFIIVRASIGEELSGLSTTSGKGPRS